MKEATCQACQCKFTMWNLHGYIADLTKILEDGDFPEVRILCPNCVVITVKLLTEKLDELEGGREGKK